jgi:hypothetical protein
MKNLIFICFLAISSSLFSQNGNGFTVAVTGSDWAPIILEQDITKAGDDYNLDYNSISKQTTITITSTFQNKQFIVSIYKEDNTPSWPSGLDLQITQTYSSNLTTASPPPPPQSIPDYSGPLLSFSIEGSKTNQMSFEYKIRGISVLLPVALYTTTIFFTVTMM